MDLKQACFWFRRIKYVIVCQLFAMSLGHYVDSLIDNRSVEDPYDTLMFDEYFPLVWRTDSLELPSQQSVSLVQLLDPEGEGATIAGNVGSFPGIPEDLVLQLHCSEKHKSRTIEKFLNLQVQRT